MRLKFELKNGCIRGLGFLESEIVEGSQLQQEERLEMHKLDL